MKVRAQWASGSISTWDTTILNSNGGVGPAIAFDFLDISDPERIGVILIRNHYEFGSGEMTSYSPTPALSQKVIIPPEQVDDLVSLSVDGMISLARMEYDEEGNALVSLDGELVNVALPQRHESSVVDEDEDDFEDEDFE